MPRIQCPAWRPILGVALADLLLILTVAAFNIAADDEPELANYYRFFCSVAIVVSAVTGSLVAWRWVDPNGRPRLAAIFGAAVLSLPVACLVGYKLSVNEFESTYGPSLAVGAFFSLGFGFSVGAGERDSG